MKPTNTQLKTWDTVHRGTKIRLEKTQWIKSFNGEMRLIKKGYYYITGFWVDMAGLSKKAGDRLNDQCIQSIELSKFNLNI